jgi:hypothetical protein
MAERKGFEPAIMDSLSVNGLASAAQPTLVRDHLGHLMRSIEMPSRGQHTDSLERSNRALGLAKVTPLSEPMAAGTPRPAGRR